MNLRQIFTIVLTSTLLVGAALSSQAFAQDKRIMVFGDSNSWGWIPVPEILPATRYAKDVRWPGVMANQLGDGFTIINESLSARTAATSDDTAGVNGAGVNGLEYLPAALASHMPLDLVVIMLGTNDVKPYLNRNNLDISLDILSLASEVRKNTGVLTGYQPAKVMIVVPPALGTIPDLEWLQAVFPEASVQQSAQLAGVLCPIAKGANVPCFDGGTVAAITGADGIHMTSDNHQKLGVAVAEQVKQILQ